MKKNKFSTHKVIKDFGNARIGDTCHECGKIKQETQFHSNELYDFEKGRRENYWVEWLKDNEVSSYLKEND